MFSRAARGRPAGTNGAALSFIGPEVTIAGDIATTGRLHIDGKVIGDIRCTGLTQGKSGVVEGNIIADEARLAGLVDGAVEAASLALDASARVTGDLLYEQVSIAAGAEVEGRFKRRRKSADGSCAAKAEAQHTPEPFGLAGTLRTAEAAE